jgi:hypothetical protein
MFIIHSRSPSPIPEVIEKIINIKKRKAEYDIYDQEKNEI